MTCSTSSARHQTPAWTSAAPRPPHRLRESSRRPAWPPRRAPLRRPRRGVGTCRVSQSRGSASPPVVRRRLLRYRRPEGLNPAVFVWSYPERTPGKPRVIRTDVAVLFVGGEAPASQLVLAVAPLEVVRRAPGRSQPAQVGLRESQDLVAVTTGTAQGLLRSRKRIAPGEGRRAP
jgi:hypothetical protein